MSVDKKEIEKGLFEIVAKVFKMEESDIKPETRWEEDLHVKSVHGMKLAAFINYKFNIKLPMSKLVECDTMEDAVVMLDEFINN